eukprot:SAG11_NODE_1705_length_4412_cov_5.951078_2_plen_85_part_00
MRWAGYISTVADTTHPSGSFLTYEEAVMKLRLDKRCKVAQWECLIERVANSIVGPALAIQDETGAEWRACRDDRTRFWRLQHGV